MARAPYQDRKTLGPPSPISNRGPWSMLPATEVGLLQNTMEGTLLVREDEE